MKSRKGHGNVKAQKERRRARLKNRPHKQAEKVQLYDGNMSYYPAAYCKIHGAYLTQGLIDTHRCAHRQCRGLEWIEPTENQKSKNS